MASRPKKDGVFALDGYVNKRIRVKLQGGREGVLKGFDAATNLVMDDCSEVIRDPEDLSKLLPASRPIGLVVTRGTAVMTLAPEDGMEEIENPFAEAE